MVNGAKGVNYGMVELKRSKLKLSGYVRGILEARWAKRVHQGGIKGLPVRRRLPMVWEGKVEQQMLTITGDGHKGRVKNEGSGSFSCRALDKMYRHIL